MVCLLLPVFAVFLLISIAVNMADGKAAKADDFTFCRLFPTLDPFLPSDADLLIMGLPSNDSARPALMEDSRDRDFDSNGHRAAGWTFLGQLLAHDMSLEITSDLNAAQPQSVNVDLIRNQRTPFADMDSIYGTFGEKGKGTSPSTDGDAFIDEQTGKFVLGLNAYANMRDYSRNEITDNALAVDQRNDENTILAQLTVAFMQLHNIIVDAIVFENAKHKPGKHVNAVFAAAKTETIKHWHSILLNNYLPLVVKESTIEEIANGGGVVYTDPLFDNNCMPVEFSAAIARFGHTLLRGAYRMNAVSGGIRLFPLNERSNITGVNNLLGGISIDPVLMNIDWTRFFNFTQANTGDPNDPIGQIDEMQVTKTIDRFYASSMLRLPLLSTATVAVPGEDDVTEITNPGMPSSTLPNDDSHLEFDGAPIVSLASLTLLRGKRLGLPSGQAIAEHLGFEVLTNEQFELDNEDEVVLPDPLPLDHAPLQLYIDEEGRIQEEGQILGEVGGQIYAEVVMAMIERTPDSYYGDWLECVLEVDAGGTGKGKPKGKKKKCWTSILTNESVFTIFDLFREIGYVIPSPPETLLPE